MQKKEELQEIINDLDRTVKMLVGKDFELSEIKEKREAELKELDHIAKLLIRRDLELNQTREKRENEFREIEERTKELEESKRALLNILEDVEESRISAEEEKNKTLALIANFSDGVLFFDSKNKLSLVNIKAQDFFNIKYEDIFGKSVEELNSFENLKSLVSLIGNGLKIISKTREELTLDNDLVLEVSTVSVDLEKQKLGTLLILHDITREKSVERLKTEFVAIAAHQLRTPLSAIKWTLLMFLDGDIGHVSEVQSEFLQKTYDSNERMINLVNDLLNVTRIEEGKFLQKIEKCDVIELLQEVIKSEADAIAKKNLKFSLILPDKNAPSVNVDKEKIVLAIKNLLENAVNYTKNGEITLSGAYDIDQKRFLIKVQDTGIGIPKEQHERVFSRFFRSSNALKTETEGTGLGLFISKNIIESHGGKIWFESVEGKGTTFYLTLPIDGIARKNLK